MPALSEDTKLDVLNDHYKDTFAYLQEFRKRREQLLLLILVVATIMLFQIFSPKDAEDAIGQFIAKGLDLQGPVDISFVGSVLWFSWLCLVIRYFQTAVHIERQYDYIHDLEKQLSQLYDGKAFTREGQFYLARYPLFSNWAHILYTIVFPVVLAIVVIGRVVNEILLATHLSLLLVFNVVISLCILVSVVLYVMMVHFKK
jgi:hypothetical protein